MFELSKEWLKQVKASLQNPVVLATDGPVLYFSACSGGTCKGTCSGSCAHMCTRGCRGVGRGN